MRKRKAKIDLDQWLGPETSARRSGAGFYWIVCACLLVLAGISWWNTASQTFLKYYWSQQLLSTQTPAAAADSLSGLVGLGPSSLTSIINGLQNPDPSIATLAGQSALEELKRIVPADAEPSAKIVPFLEQLAVALEGIGPPASSVHAAWHQELAAAISFRLLDLPIEATDSAIACCRRITTRAVEAIGTPDQPTLLADIDADSIPTAFPQSFAGMPASDTTNPRQAFDSTLPRPPLPDALQAALVPSDSIGRISDIADLVPPPPTPNVVGGLLGQEDPFPNSLTGEAQQGSSPLDSSSSSGGVSAQLVATPVDRLDVPAPNKATPPILLIKEPTALAEDALANATRIATARPNGGGDPIVVTETALKPGSTTRIQVGEPRAAVEGIETANVEQVLRLLTSVQPRVAEAGASELARRGWPSSQIELAVRLATGESAARIAEMESIAQRSDLDLRPWLLWLAKDADLLVRRRALIMLGSVSDPTLMADLRFLLARETDSQAAETLRRILISAGSRGATNR